MRISPRYAVALVAAFGLFPVALDSTIVNVAIAPISKALNTDVNTIQWIFIGYLLAIESYDPAQDEDLYAYFLAEHQDDL